MTKKQILITSIICGVILIGATAFFGYNLFTKEKSSESVASKKSSDNINGGATIPLGAHTDNSKGGLTVDDSATYNANLGSSSANSSFNNTGTAVGPSSNDFQQYEQYKDSDEAYFGDIIEGNGAVAQKNSQLVVTYKGYLTDGSVFDESRTGANGLKEPLIFTLGSGQLISGFEQGVVGMKAGGSRRIIIPPALGYGNTEQNSIPANSVLIFDVQLLTVQ